MRKLKFSGHQTFHLRYGWLEKGYNFACAGKSFSAADAMVDLGVGKNMVASIEYWCRMAEILDADSTPTKLAHKLLDEKNGWDPYLENDASWWLVHWKIVSNPHFITAASVCFSELKKNEFSKTELAEFIENRYAFATGKRISSLMLERDIDCYMRSYHPRPSKKDISDGGFECPLQELHLIEPLCGESSRYRFNIGPKHTLPPQIIGYTLWDMLCNRNERRDDIRLQEALYGSDSPGQIFMIDENSLVEAVQALQQDSKFGHCFDLIEYAGTARIRCAIADAHYLLDSYYGKGS